MKEAEMLIANITEKMILVECLGQGMTNGYSQGGHVLDAKLGHISPT